MQSLFLFPPSVFARSSGARGARPLGAPPGFLRRVAAALFGAILLAGLPVAWSAAQAAEGRPHVYILRGWANVFSRGMDALAAKLQAVGIEASVHNHAEWVSLADQIFTDYQRNPTGTRVALIGHSLGANAVVLIAQRLATRAVPIDLLVTYDPNETLTVSPNVRRAVNFYSPGILGFPLAQRPAVENVNVSQIGVSHVSIDKQEILHAQTVEEIRRAFR